MSPSWPISPRVLLRCAGLCFPSRGVLYVCHQLARRKADELEDFGVGKFPSSTSSTERSQPQRTDTTPSGPQFSEDITEEGITIVEEFLRAWASSTQDEDGDEVMDQTSEGQLQELKNCFEKYRSQIEDNPWIRSMISSL
jgi:DNA mismatch repair protein MSH2